MVKLPQCSALQAAHWAGFASENLVARGTAGASAGSEPVIFIGERTTPNAVPLSDDVVFVMCALEACSMDFTLLTI